VTTPTFSRTTSVTVDPVTPNPKKTGVKISNPVDKCSAQFRPHNARSFDNYDFGHHALQGLNKNFIIVIPFLKLRATKIF
jgi:hypothetical protein